MTLPTHIILGFIIGKATGSYELAVLTSVAVDTDHLVSYARHGALKSPKLFWKAITDQEDPWGDQRGIFHNLLSLVILTSAAYFLFGQAISMIFGLSYAGHLLLDAISDSDSWFFRPFSNFRTRGFIPYYSKFEALFFAALILIWLVI